MLELLPTHTVVPVSLVSLAITAKLILMSAQVIRAQTGPPVQKLDMAHNPQNPVSEMAFLSNGTFILVSQTH
jgi:hypothetical protein